jgi:AcrR family transcriptional regulator
VLAGRDDQVDVGRAPGMPAAGREEPAERAVVGDQRPLAAIIAAAQELQRHGTAPTVEQVADKARVSHATAYHYFPTKEALLVEVSDITPALAPVETLLANSAPAAAGSGRKGGRELISDLLAGVSVASALARSSGRQGQASRTGPADAL